MRYNLKEIVTNIPSLSNLIYDELITYGECQFIRYTNGDFILDLITEKELSMEDISKITQIVSNHDCLKYKKQEKVKELKQNATQAIFTKYPLFKQINAALGLYDDTKTKEIKDFIKVVKDQVDSVESTINSKIKESTLNAVDITIKI